MAYSSISGPHLLTGATAASGNNTHDGLDTGVGAAAIALEFEVVTAGATPTVTYKYQGSMDNTNWFDVLYVTDASDTAAATTKAVTSVGKSICFLANSGSRFYKWYRCVTTSNTNVTYQARLYIVS